MARANLGALLGNVEDPNPSGPTSDLVETTPQVSADTPELVAEKSTQIVTARPRARGHAQASLETAAYLRLVRKETRLREDQQNQLTLEARRLNRAKAGGTARITDNTLIRVAVDLLLANIAHASGDDESAILKSLNS